MQIVINPKNIPIILEKAKSILEKGGIVVYPSDTVYGIAVDATNLEAIKKLSHLKMRNPDQKYSYNFSDIEMIKKYHNLTAEQEKILKKYLPGPYTFILSDDLSVRIPKNSIIVDITRNFGRPTTATSANITGRMPATRIGELDAKIYLKSDLIIEDPNFQPHQPSTIVDISKEPFSVLRHGELPFP